MKEGDLFSAICEVGPIHHGKQLLKVHQPPFVLVGTEKPTIVVQFQKCLRGSTGGFGPGKAYSLFNYIEERSRNDPDYPCESKTLPDAGERVNTYLERTAIKWRKLGDEEILLGFSSVITEEQAGKLLSYWYKNVCLRKLWLFGLTNKDIRNCKMDLEKIYQACLNNPLTLYALSKEKCIEILARQNKKPSPEEDYCSDIARKIYDRYENCSWIGVPSKNIIAEFPDAPKFRDRLCKDYGIVMDPLTATIYLPYLHKVELRILRMVEEMKKRDFPVHPVVFSNTKLSPDQKLAVTGALTDSICFITGTAGTGKTTVIKEIVANLESKGIRCALASFTGKAVSRIKEVTERKGASTMHMMIVKKHEHKREEFKHLIIDEAFNVSMDLLHDFIEAFPGSIG